MEKRNQFAGDALDLAMRLAHLLQELTTEKGGDWDTYADGNELASAESARAALSRFISTHPYIEQRLAHLKAFGVEQSCSANTPTGREWLRLNAVLEESNGVWKDMPRTAA